MRRSNQSGKTKNQNGYPRERPWARAGAGSSKLVGKIGGAWADPRVHSFISRVHARLHSRGDESPNYEHRREFMKRDRASSVPTFSSESFEFQNFMGEEQSNSLCCIGTSGEDVPVHQNSVACAFPLISSRDCER